MTDTNARNQLSSLLLHLDGAYAPNTLRAYKADMLEFITYCDKAAKCALPADPNTVSDFLMQTIDKGIKSSTIRRKVSSISAIHRLPKTSTPIRGLALTTWLLVKALCMDINAFLYDSE